MLSHPFSRATGRTAGALYLTIAVCGGFSIGYVPLSLVVADDPAQTALNYAANAGLYRLSILADIVVILAELVLSVLLYQMFRAAGPSTAMVALTSRLAMALVMAVMLFFNGLILQSTGDADRLMTLVMMRAEGVYIWQLFFGAHLIALGLLIRASGLVPQWLGWGMLIGAWGYLIEALARLILPQPEVLSGVIVPLLVVVTIAEVSFALWLLIRGQRASQPDAAWA